MYSALGIKSINKTIVILAIVCGLIVASLTQFKLLEQWNYEIQHYLFTKPSSQQIVVIAIDERSLQRFGRWPWSRAIHAQLINELTEAKVRAIGLDILFMEADSNHLDGDLQLAQAIKHNGHVVLPSLLVETKDNQLTLTPPLHLLSREANQLAATKIQFDSSGLVNGIFSKITINNKEYPSFAIAILAADSHQSSDKNTTVFPSLFPFSDSLNDYQQFSYVDVLGNPNIHNALKDKFIIISVTASGVAQRFATSLSHHKERINGAELNVKMLANLLHQKVIQPLNINWASFFNFSYVFIIMLSYGFVTSRQSFGLLILSLLTHIAISLALLSCFRVWHSPIETSAVLLLGYSLWSNYRQEMITQVLAKEKNKTQATLSSISDGVITTDANGIVTFMNPAAEKITGLALVYAVGMEFQTLILFKKPQERLALMNAIASGQPIEMPVPLYIRNHIQQEYAIRFSVNPVFHKNNTIVISLTDVSEIINTHRKIQHLATHDPLTGLPNRVLLRKRILAAIEYSQENNQQLAILFIDLDGFKKINDGLGHAVGDELLIEISKRLKATIKTSDTAARWGGDEFILLLTELTHKQQGTDIAKALIKNIGQAVIVNHQELFVTPSIGISCFPDNGRTVNELLEAADAAMYKVKETGRNNYHYYDETISDEAKEKLNLEREMHHALENKQFEMYYQLQVDLISQKIIGVEALIRWQHPSKGLLSPNQFIPLAEEVGLIVPIGSWVIHEVCQQLHLWQTMNMPNLYVSINISARQFMEKNLVAQIQENLQHYQLKSHFLQIEITESLMITHLAHVEDALKQLSEMGIVIAIDDFGTGYSSLSFLKRFSIDILKIDRSFVHNIFLDDDDSSIISAVSSLAHSMKMTLVAEGVETLEQSALLTQLGCHIGQGYYFSKPLTAADMTALLVARQGVFKKLENTAIINES